MLDGRILNALGSQVMLEQMPDADEGARISVAIQRDLDVLQRWRSQWVRWREASESCRAEQGRSCHWRRCDGAELAARSMNTSTMIDKAGSVDGHTCAASSRAAALG